MISRTNTSRILASALIGAFAIAGCDQQADAPAQASDSSSSASPQAPASDGFVVQTVNYPLMYFAQRIAGDHADVRFPAPADGDPAFWVPERDAIVEMQSADLILLNGASYAKWVGKVSLPMTKVVDTSAPFAPAYIEIEGETTHSHGEGGEHSHAGTAFTTWLDMDQAKTQAGSILEALVERLPDHEADFRANADALMADLDELDAALQSAGERLAGVPMVASHPVYQYLSRRYGFAIEALYWEPEMVISESDLADLQAVIDEHPAAWMIWEGEPTEAARETLAGRGIMSVVFDPCGNRPEEGDWLSVMRVNIAQLEIIEPE